MTLEAFVLGSGGSMPLPHRHLTSVLLRREGDLFLFDCGEGTQMSLRRLNLRWKKIHSIFISHTHADHVTGLPGILMLSSQVDRDEPLYIYGPKRIAEYIESNRRTLEMYINYEIVVREIEDPSVAQVLLDHPEYQIRSFPVKHTRVCVGYSLSEKPRPGVFDPQKAIASGVPQGPLWSKLQQGESVNGADGSLVDPSQVLGPTRKGRKFSFVTDTLPIPFIKEEIAGSDLVICEGMFEHGLAKLAKKKMHMTGVQAAELARDAGGVKKLGLIHFSPRYTEADLKRILGQAQAIFPQTFLTRDRQTHTIAFEE